MTRRCTDGERERHGPFLGDATSCSSTARVAVRSTAVPRRPPSAPLRMRRFTPGSHEGSLPPRNRTRGGTRASRRSDTPGPTSSRSTSSLLRSCSAPASRFNAEPRGTRTRTAVASSVGLPVSPASAPSTRRCGVCTKLGEAVHRSRPRRSRSISSRPPARRRSWMRSIGSYSGSATPHPRRGSGFATPSAIAVRTRGAAPFWDSPDLWIRNADDGGATHQPPESGQDNWFYAQIRNDAAGGQCRHFVVTFHVKEFASTEFVYPGDFLPSVAARAEFDLAPGETRVVSARWPRDRVPVAGTHPCLLVAALARGDHPVVEAHVWEHANLAQNLSSIWPPVSSSSCPSSSTTPGSIRKQCSRCGEIRSFRTRMSRSCMARSPSSRPAGHGREPCRCPPRGQSRTEIGSWTAMASSRGGRIASGAFSRRATRADHAPVPASGGASGRPRRSNASTGRAPLGCPDGGRPQDRASGDFRAGNNVHDPPRAAASWRRKATRGRRRRSGSGALAERARARDGRLMTSRRFWRWLPGSGGASGSAAACQES
jgi:hypothetical protein